MESYALPRGFRVRSVSTSDFVNGIVVEMLQLDSKKMRLRSSLSFFYRPKKSVYKG